MSEPSFYPRMEFNNVPGGIGKKILDIAYGKATENILPRPFIRERNSYNPKFNGKKFNFYSPDAFALRLIKEIIPMTNSFNAFKINGEFCFLDDTVETLANIIALCLTELESLGYDENKRSKLFAKVNEKNEKLGYFVDEKNII